MPYLKTIFGLLLSAGICILPHQLDAGKGAGAGPADSAPPQVRMIYLVPSDREPQADYVAAIERGIRNVQFFYRNQLGNGRTFRLHAPVVEVYKTSHPASYYAASIWERTLGDGFALTGGKFNDPLNRWIYYIDADPDCRAGGTFGGTQGVAVLPKNDLRGLSGVKAIPICPGDDFSAYDRVCRWIGGLGHELGHAFDLPHPPGCDQRSPGESDPGKALMCRGYLTYPDAVLLPEDKKKLAANPFFPHVSLPAGLPSCDAPGAKSK